MKKFLVIICATMFAMTGNAQLRVLNNGHVEAGSVRADCFLINAWDSVNWVNRYGVYCDLGPYTYYNGSTVPCATSIYGHTNAADNSPYEYTNIAIGVKGEAQGAYTVNYGVYGYVPFNNYYGAGIYGTIYSTPKLFDNNYAGFFDGPVAITSGLYVKGGTYTSFWSQPMRGVQNPETDGEVTTLTITEQLSNLQMGTFYEQEVDEEDSLNVTEKREETGKASVSQKTTPRMHYGLSADQLEEVFPDLVLDSSEGEKYVNYVEMVPILVQAINELTIQVTELKQLLGIEDVQRTVPTVPMTSNTDDISFTVPDGAQQATLTIYDLSGKQVRTATVDGTTIDGTAYTRGLPTGTYICTLLVDGRTQGTRKVIVKE